MASIEPCTSPLITSGNSLRPGGLELIHHLLERAAHAGLPRRHLLALLPGAVIGDLARARFESTTREPVARFRRAVEAKHFHRHRRPGGDDGVAGVRRQCAHPAPFRCRRRRCRRASSVPRCTSTVATGPRPRSSRASITVPSAARFGLALSSSTSACSAIMSSSLSRLSLLLRGDLDFEHVAAERLRPEFRAAAARCARARAWRPACRSC